LQPLGAIRKRTSCSAGAGTTGTAHAFWRDWGVDSPSERKPGRAGPDAAWVRRTARLRGSSTSPSGPCWVLALHLSHAPRRPRQVPRERPLACPGPVPRRGRSSPAGAGNLPVASPTGAHAVSLGLVSWPAFGGDTRVTDVDLGAVLSGRPRAWSRSNARVRSRRLGPVSFQWHICWSAIGRSPRRPGWMRRWISLWITLWITQWPGNVRSPGAAG
jgi:hypothetical protein